MSQKYPSGIINKTAPVTVGPVDGEGGSAPGVWTLDQAMALNKQGLWPKPPIQGQIWSWGYNFYGQLGLNNTTDYSSPKQIGSLTGWGKIAAGTQFSIAIKTDGTIWSWGRNDSGQLGQTLAVATNRSSPVQIGALTDWLQVVCGNYHALAIKTNGTLWAWGRNSAGQLGLGNTTNRSSPVQVGALTTWSKIAAGNSYSAAVRSDGTLWTWGDNTQGQLGLGTSGAYTERSSPTQVGALTNWRDVVTGQATIALKTDGTLWAWGLNGDGNLGLNNTTDYSSPKQVGSLTNWAQINCCRTTTIAIKTDNTAWIWGGNAYGQLWRGNTTNYSSPVQLGALTNWSIIAGMADSVFGLKTDGTLSAWGRNQRGQLGFGNTTNRSSPVQVGVLTTWVRLPKMPMAESTLAIKTP